MNLFLNGVCRHEHSQGAPVDLFAFLNGVCRHEQKYKSMGCALYFLNGVCRHERPTDQACKSV
ncbi:hypothetical protein ACIN5143_A4010 [Acinetobacter baumannii OIFC143]|nr:hypothetical protein ACIN5143_A4010 [Acinetobacter baumannii OIFC143]